MIATAIAMPIAEVEKRYGYTRRRGACDGSFRGPSGE